jgi:hypothetical protein
MAGNVTGLHVFTADVGPEALSLLDGNFSPLATTINTLATFANYYADTGAVNALVVTTVGSQVFSLAAGVFVEVAVANTTTTTTPTLNINATGAHTIVNSDGSAVLAGAMVANGLYRFGYDGANYRLQNPSAMKFSSLSVGAPTSGVVALTVTGIANSFGLRVIGSSTAGQSAGLRVEAGTNSSDVCTIFLNQSGTVIFCTLFGDGHGNLGPTATLGLSWSIGGNLTIANPSSGVGLTIAGGGMAVTGTAALAALTATTGVFTGLVQAQLGLAVTGAAFTSRGITDNATATAMTLAAGGDITARGVSICKFKSATTSRNTTTTGVNDPDLTYAIPGAGTYDFECAIMAWGDVTGTQGLSANLNFSGSFLATANFYEMISGASVFITQSVQSGPNVALTQFSANIGTAAPGQSFSIKGTVVTTGAGTFAFSWAQKTSSANNTNVGQGCYLKVTQLS